MKESKTIKPVELRNMIFNGILLFLITYFIYHSVSGQRGVVSMIRIQKDINDKRALLAEVQEQKCKLENRVNKLYPKSLDIDLLDELARLNSAYIENDEKLLMWK